MLRLVGGATLLLALCMLSLFLMPVLMVVDGVTRTSVRTDAYTHWLLDILDRRVFND